MMLRGRGLGRNEGKQVHWKNTVERTAMWSFFCCLVLNVDTSPHWLKFFFNWPYFQISLLWEKKLDRFSGELTSGRASTKPKSWKSHPNLHQRNITQRDSSRHCEWRLVLAPTQAWPTDRSLSGMGRPPERPHWTHTDFEKKLVFINICSIVLIIHKWIIHLTDFWGQILNPRLTVLHHQYTLHHQVIQV